MFLVYIGKGSCKCLWSILAKGHVSVVVYIGKGSCKCLWSILVKGPVSVCGIYW